MDDRAVSHQAAPPPRFPMEEVRRTYSLPATSSGAPLSSTGSRKPPLPIDTSNSVELESLLKRLGSLDSELNFMRLPAVRATRRPVTPVVEQPEAKDEAEELFNSVFSRCATNL
eukprot:scaffold83970_cov35-Prasinocladus_malaysianus.AAC.1